MNLKKGIRRVVWIISFIWAAVYFCVIAFDISGGFKLIQENLGIAAFVSLMGFCTVWSIYWGIYWFYLWVKKDL